MTNKLAVAGPDSKWKLPEAEPAGFWPGFWHGLIAPIAFVVSLFNPHVRIYETNNNGGWYDFGFILGVSSSLGGGATVNVNKQEEEEERASDDSLAPEEE